MKKTLLLGAVISLASSAAMAAGPVIIPEFYTTQTSANGRFIVSDTGMESISVYDVETGETVEYPSYTLGTGTCVSNNGTIVVSDVTDHPVVIKDGEEHEIPSLEDYSMANLYCITPDATRVCGIVTNLENDKEYDGSMYVPVVMEMDAAGNLGAPVFLPHPDKDFFGDSPQYCSANFISADGKTVIGNVISNDGFSIYPIVYKQDDKGEWSYTLPSESLFNPDHIVLPENPGEFDEESPAVTDYMTPENAAAYNAAMQAYYESGYDESLYPNAANYMTAEEIEAYNAAVDAYNARLTDYYTLYYAYVEAKMQVEASSTFFAQGSMCLSPDGKQAAYVAVKEEGFGWDVTEVYNTFIFNLTDGTYKRLEASTYGKVIPNQIFDNGMVVACTPQPTPWDAVPLPPFTYVLNPGADEYIPLVNYFAESGNTEASTWMEENLKTNIMVGADEANDWAPIYEEYLMSGRGLGNPEMTIFSAGVLTYMMEESEFSEYAYMTYVFSGLKSGISNTVADADAVVDIKAVKGGVLVINGDAADVTVYDLSGRTVYSAQGVNGIVDTNLSAGIYVVAAKSLSGNVTSVKVAF